MWPERSPVPGISLPDDSTSGRILVEARGETARSLRQTALARGLPPEAVAGELLRRGLEQELRRLKAEAALSTLTPRQKEIARLVVRGQTNQEIARALWLSPETVKTHLRRTFERFAVHSKAELRLFLADLDGERPPAGE